MIRGHHQTGIRHPLVVLSAVLLLTIVALLGTSVVPGAAGQTMSAADPTAATDAASTPVAGTHGDHGASDGDGAVGAAAVDSSSPYAGVYSTTAEIRALTPEEIGQIERGEGAGYALPAELNGLPGPRHVLDMAEELGLSTEQITQIESLYAAMQAEAITAGGRYLTAQARLEGDLRSRSVSGADLPGRVAEVSVREGDLMAVHLAAHLETAEVLTDEQIAAYNRMRGYT